MLSNWVKILWLFHPSVDFHDLIYFLHLHLSRFFLCLTLGLSWCLKVFKALSADYTYSALISVMLITASTYLRMGSCSDLAIHPFSHPHFPSAERAPYSFCSFSLCAQFASFLLKWYRGLRVHPLLSEGSCPCALYHARFFRERICFQGGLAKYLALWRPSAFTLSYP